MLDVVNWPILHIALLTFNFLSYTHLSDLPRLYSSIRVFKRPERKQAGMEMAKIKTQSKKRSTRRKYSTVGCSVYGLAVARGGSYLASTSTEESRARQLQATVDDFVKSFDGDELHFFLEDIRDWLRNRKNSAGVDAVTYYLEHGTTPPLAEPVKYGKLRKSGVKTGLKSTVVKKTVPVSPLTRYATAA